MFEKIEKHEYDEMKRRAIRFEEKNLRYILVVPCSGDQGWCEMADHSALIYRNLVCDKLGVSAAMTDDYDSYYLQYRIGRVRTRGMDTVLERVKKAGIYKKDAMKGKCLIIEIKKPLDIEEMLELEKTESERQLALGQIVRCQPIDPVLYQKLVEASGRLYNLCTRKLDRMASRTSGERIVNLISEVNREYIRFSSRVEMSEEEKLERWLKMKETLVEVLIEVQILASGRMWKREICLSIGELLNDIENIIDKHCNQTLRKIKKGEESGAKKKVKSTARKS